MLKRVDISRLDISKIHVKNKEQSNIGPNSQCKPPIPGNLSGCSFSHVFLSAFLVPATRGPVWASAHVQPRRAPAGGPEAWLRHAARQPGRRALHEGLRAPRQVLDSTRRVDSRPRGEIKDDPWRRSVSSGFNLWVHWYHWSHLMIQRQPCPFRF